MHNVPSGRRHTYSPACGMSRRHNPETVLVDDRGGGDLDLLARYASSMGLGSQRAMRVERYRRRLACCPGRTMHRGLDWLLPPLPFAGKGSPATCRRCLLLSVGPMPQALPLSRRGCQGRRARSTQFGIRELQTTIERHDEIDLTLQRL